MPTSTLTIARVRSLLGGDAAHAQALRFLGVGVCNTLFGYGVFAAATLAGANSLAALIISTIAGATFNFQTSRRLVFRDASRQRMVRFFGVYGVLLLANWAALSGLEHLGAPALIAQAGLVLPFAALSFAAQKTVVFGQFAPAPAGLVRLFQHQAPAATSDAMAFRLFVAVLAAGSGAFLIGFLAQPWMAALACLLMALSLWAVLAPAAGPGAGPDKADSLKLWAFAAALALALCLLGGEGRLFYANTDWQIRDAVLADLSTHPWPVLYQPAGEAAGVLRAPLGMYILPSLVGRALGWPAAQPALLIQNTILLAGVLASFMAGARRWSGRLIIAAMFVAFSGLDLLGQLLVTHFAQPPAWAQLFPHLEIWDGGLQYSSLITDLFWTPNHGLPAWIMVAVYMSWRRGAVSVLGLAAVTGLCLLWSPLAVMGATPFVVFAGLSDWLGGRMGRLAPALLAPLVVALLPVALFLTLASGAVQHGSNLDMPFFQLRYGLFIPLEVLPLLYLAWRRTTRTDTAARRDFWICAVMLVLIPFYRIGGSNDFVMRGSIFPITLLALMAARGLADDWAQGRYKSLVLPSVILAIGAATPAAEIIRAVVEPVNPPLQAGLFTAWEQPASKGDSKATYVAPRAAYAQKAWLLRQPVR